MANGKQQRQDNIEMGIEPMTPTTLNNTERAIWSIAISIRRAVDMIQYDHDRRRRNDEERDAPRDRPRD